MDLTSCTKVGVSYKKLPRDYLPPLCSGRYYSFFVPAVLSFFFPALSFSEKLPRDYLPPLLLWQVLSFVLLY